MGGNNKPFKINSNRKKHSHNLDSGKNGIRLEFRRLTLPAIIKNVA